MSLPCPQRDALELAAATDWPAEIALKLTPEKIFQLISGETVHFLGVSNGASMREHPHSHIAVFGLKPPPDNPQNAHLLPECRFGGLITGPDDEHWHWAEGLEIASAQETIVKLRLNGHRAEYRPV